MLWVLLLACFFLLVGPACYDSWARREMVHRMETAPREPGTPYLKGGAPVRIDRGRDRVCMLLHGFPSTPADLGDLPARLAEAGWDVWAPCLRGYGTDAAELADLSADDIIEDAARELALMRARYRRVALAGYSMGGAIALILAQRDAPDALVLVNPFLKVRHKALYVLPPRFWHNVGRHLVSHVVQPHFLVHVNRPEGREALVGYRAMPVRAITELFEIGDRAAAADPGDVPVLMLLSEHDGVVAPAAVRARYDSLRTPDKSLVTYGRSDHVLFLDYDRQEAIEEVVRFLEKPAGPDR